WLVASRPHVNLPEVTLPASSSALSSSANRSRHRGVEEAPQYRPVLWPFVRSGVTRKSTEASSIRKLPSSVLFREIAQDFKIESPLPVPLRHGSSRSLELTWLVFSKRHKLVPHFPTQRDYHLPRTIQLARRFVRKRA
ncbi:UNVERIFIED_CONTAM: hypothetical protein GTU68_024269, partial [Idotea baltica]|nr:hypothetical protein [Idotea baltica]